MGERTPPPPELKQCLARSIAKMGDKDREIFLKLFKQKQTNDKGELSAAAIEVIDMARNEWKKLRQEEKRNASETT